MAQPKGWTRGGTWTVGPKDGPRQFAAEYQTDWDRVIGPLVKRAARSKSGKATALAGAIVVRVHEVKP
jgi:hypothetical protein